MSDEERAREAFVSDLLEQAEWEYADGKVRLQSLLLRAAETISKDAAALHEARVEGARRGLERAADKLAAVAGGTRATSKSLLWYEASRTVRALDPEEVSR